MSSAKKIPEWVIKRANRSSWETDASPQQDVTSVTKQCLFQRYLIPIIFVPGIMGTKLVNDQDELVWDPPDGTASAIRQLGGKQVWLSASDRKRLYIGKEFKREFLRPALDPDDEHTVAGLQQGGWSALHASSYNDTIGQFLKTLPHQAGNQMPWHYGNYIFKDYAFGYNWSQSNAASGEQLREFIDVVLEKEQYEIEQLQAEGGHEWLIPKWPKDEKKVIIITHSMGGLVGRYACIESATADKVAAILHVGMPVEGSPAMYTRGHQGVKGFGADQFLGPNAAEFVAMAGNMEGPLELLPSHLFETQRGDKAWFKVYASEDDYEQGRPPLKSLPQHGDPFAEIYLAKDKYYRLLDPKLLIPEIDKSKITSKAERVLWKEFKDKMENIIHNFHQQPWREIEVPTWILFGTSPANKADRQEQAKQNPAYADFSRQSCWDEVRVYADKKIVERTTYRGSDVITQRTHATREDRKEVLGLDGEIITYGGKQPKVEEDGEGLWKIPVKRINNKCTLLLRFCEKDGAGDGTVSVTSGASLLKNGAPIVQEALPVGKSFKRDHTEQEEISIKPINQEHQMLFDDEMVEIGVEHFLRHVIKSMT